MTTLIISPDPDEIAPKPKGAAKAGVKLRAVTFAIGAVCWLFSGGAAIARAAPHASIVEAAIAGAELCSSVYLNAMGPTAPRGLNQLYEDAGWRAVDAFPEPEVGNFLGPDIPNYLGEADLAPGVAGRVVSALGRGARSGGTRCNVLILASPGARDLLLSSLDSSATWVRLRIGDISGVRMYGRVTPSPVADIGLTIIWPVEGNENRDLEASLSTSLIPKSSLATGVFPPSSH